jgi:hypothetical protein
MIIQKAGSVFIKQIVIKAKQTVQFHEIIITESFLYFNTFMYKFKPGREKDLGFSIQSVGEIPVAFNRSIIR